MSHSCWFREIKLTKSQRQRVMSKVPGFQNWGDLVQPPSSLCHSLQLANLWSSSSSFSHNHVLRVIWQPHSSDIYKYFFELSGLWLQSLKGWSRQTTRPSNFNLVFKIFKCGSGGNTEVKSVYCSPGDSGSALRAHIGSSELHLQQIWCPWPFWAPALPCTHLHMHTNQKQ